jgi:hypothetical protein
MNVMLKNNCLNKFLAIDGWTESKNHALLFPSGSKALERCTADRLRDMSLVYDFGSALYDLTFKIEDFKQREADHGQ